MNASIPTEERTSQRILEAAGRVFADQGYEAATVREICRLAGIRNIAAVNYYFGDKERLYIETVRAAYQAISRQVPLPEWSPATPPEQKLRIFISTFVARLTGGHVPEWTCRLLMREMIHTTAACAEFVHNFVRPNFEILQRILGEMLPAEVPAVKRHLIAFSIVGQCLHYRLARNVVVLLLGEEEFRTFDQQRLTDHITEFSLAAIRQYRKHAAREELP